jgi:hypothetical protein
MFYIDANRFISMTAVQKGNIDNEFDEILKDKCGHATMMSVGVIQKRERKIKCKEKNSWSSIIGDKDDS